MGSGQFLWLLSCLLQESNKKKDGCSVHGILQWVCLVQNVSFVGAEPSQAPKFLSPVPPLLGCFLAWGKIRQMKRCFCLKCIGRRGIFANFADVCKTFSYRHGVQGAKPPCK